MPLEEETPRVGITRLYLKIFNGPAPHRFDSYGNGMGYVLRAVPDVFEGPGWSSW